ncbi:MAG: PIG-L family deacetylase [Clostridia bacterium]|nr:PIG-L family deacetylase [Clostridia bacterium]MDD7700992.1 PIG-L family deacetylase [Eubacteriales bacterium]MDY2826731.1 PIG-L family deacetylase [Eubacteriales bacterium]
MNVLAIGAHPDDIEIACAGTLAKCVKRGDRVTVCHVSTGNLGHVVIPPDELTLIRAEEARKAGSMAGIKVICAGFNDLDIFDGGKEARDRIVDVIKAADPDFIITHNPDDYMPDHTAVSRLVFDASFAATLPNYKSREKNPARLVPIYYMDTLAGVNFVPTEFVDITDEIDLKLRMLNCHESQIVWMRDHDGIDFPDMVRTCSRYRGYQCGANYAEGFRQCNVYLKGTAKRLLP